MIGLKYLAFFHPSISKLTCASPSKRVVMLNHSYENEFRLHVHFYVNQTHFQLKVFALGLVLKPRHKVTQK